MTHFRQTPRRLTLVVAAALVLCGGSVPSGADAPPQAQAVLSAEHRWLGMLTMGDKKALAAFLPGNFVHITYKGKIRYRADEIAALSGPKDYTQFLSEQTVDFVHNVAIVHGLNTISRLENVIMELRYTDVYTKEGGKWRPISAQETQIAAP